MARSGSQFGGGGAGINNPPPIDPAATGAVATLRAGIKGNLTWSKLSGSSALSIAASTGVVSIDTAIGAGNTVSATFRVQNTTGDAVEKTLTFKGALAAPTLGNLTVSPNTTTVNSTYTGSVSGKTADSVLSLTGAGAAGLSVSGSTITGTPTTVGDVNVVETLAGAIGSPKTNTKAFSITAIVLNALTLSPATATVGVEYNGFVTGKKAGSQLSLTGAGAAGLSVSGSAITGTPTAEGPVNVVETLAGASNTPRTTSSLLTVAAGSSAATMTVSNFNRTPKSTNRTQTDPAFNPATMIGIPADETSPTAVSITADAVQPILIDTTDLRQTYQGVGVQLQDATEYNANTYLTPAQKDALLTDMFSPDSVGCSYVRGYLGSGAFLHQRRASDGGADYYTLTGPLADNVVQDVTLPGFNMARQMEEFGNITKLAAAKNADMRIFLSVASPPAWMKTSVNDATALDANGFPAPGTSGYMSSSFYQHYANYWVRGIQAHIDVGIPIYGVNPANEPANRGTYPTCGWSASQLITFMRDWLKPALVNAGLGYIKIFAGEVNYNSTPQHVTPVITRSDMVGIVDGVTYHGYNYDDSYRIPYASYPNLEYFMNEFRTLTTEATDSGQRNMWQMMILAARYGIGAFALFVLGLDKDGNPTSNNLNRRGIVTINKDGSGYTRNPEYYLLRQWGRNLKRGARYAHSVPHINLSSTTSGVLSAAWVNPNGDRVVFIQNLSLGTTRNFDVVDAATGRKAPVGLGGGQAITMTYQASNVGGKAAALNQPTVVGTDTQVSMSWTLPIDANRQAIAIYRGLGTAEKALVAIRPADATSWVDTTVKTGTTYQYQMRAIGGGLGPLTTSVEVVTSGSSAVTLKDVTLTFDPPLQAGVTSTGTLTGTTPGESFEINTSDGANYSIAAGVTTFQVTSTNPAADQDVTYSIVGTLASATNSPHTSPAAVFRTLPAAQKSITFTTPSVTQDEGGPGTTKTYAFPVSRTDTTAALDVSYSFNPGTTDANDYPSGVLPSGGTLSFAAGEGSKSVFIIVRGDADVEPNEYFTVSLSTPAGYIAGASMTATGNINNDDTSTIPTNVLIRDTFTETEAKTLDLHTPEKGGAWSRKSVVTTSRTISTGPSGVTFSNADSSVATVQYSNAAAMPSAGCKVDYVVKVRTQAGGIAIVGCAVAGADQGYSLVYNAGSGAWTMQRRGSSNVTLGSVVTNKIAAGASASVSITFAANGDITWSINGGTPQTVNDATYARTGTIDIRQNFLGSGVGGSTDTTGCGIDELTVTSLA